VKQTSDMATIFTKKIR